MLEIISILLIFILSIIIIYKRFDISIYLLIVLTVLVHKELFSFFTWDLLPIRIFMFALLLLSIYEFVKHLLKRKLTFSSIKVFILNPFSLLLILMLLINTVSIYFSLNLKASILLLGFFTTVVFASIKLLNYFQKSDTNPLKYLKFYIGVTFILTLFGYFQLFLYDKTGKIIGALWNIPTKLSRVGATFWDVNHFGALIALLLPISAVLFLTERNWKTKIYYFITSASLAASLLLTNSRSAWIIEAAAILFFLGIIFFKRFNFKGFIYIFIALLLVVLPLFGLYLNKASSFRATVKDYFHYRLDSFDSHILLLRGTFEIYQKYPLLGGGYGGFFEHFSKTKIGPELFSRDPAALSTRVPAHTIWGEILSGTGIIGLTVYISFFLLILGVLTYCALTLKNKTDSLLSTAMAAAFFGINVAGIFYSYNSEFFWLFLVLIYAFAIKKISGNQNISDVLQYFVNQNKLPLIFLLIVSAILIFGGIFSTHLIPWDEAIYAKISKNMVLSGDYLTMRWHSDAVWYEKPPLYMWSTAFFMNLFGVVEIASRITSAIFGLATIILVYIFSKKHFGKVAAYFCALSLITTTGFLYYSRTGMLDISVGFFITASLIKYFNISQSNSKYKSIDWLIIGLLIGVATMIKGVIGLLPFLTILLSELLVFKKFKPFNYILILVSLLVVALPWHIFMYKTFGFQFIQNYIGYHVLDRGLTAIEDKGRPLWWYIIVAKVSMRLWFITFLFSFPFAIYNAIKKQKTYQLLIVWSMTILIFFSLAKSKLAWYLVPFYPVAQIINSVGIAWFIDYVSKFRIIKKIINNPIALKFLIVYFSTIIILFYFSLNYKLVYIGDVTGSQARLLQLKDQIFGIKQKVFVDRIELPLVLYYTDGPFEIIDFVPNIKDRVPEVESNEPLILLTKKGRFSTNVSRYLGEPSVVREDGDYLLWYLPPKVGSFKVAPLN